MESVQLRQKETTTTTTKNSNIARRTSNVREIARKNELKHNLRAIVCVWYGYVAGALLLYMHNIIVCSIRRVAEKNDEKKNCYQK